jgi:hypothetical protein
VEHASPAFRRFRAEVLVSGSSRAECVVVVFHCVCSHTTELGAMRMVIAGLNE